MTLSNLRGLHDPVRTEREARLEAALRKLLEHWDEFRASEGNQHEAYYKLAKYAHRDWEDARTALSTTASKGGGLARIHNDELIYTGPPARMNYEGAVDFDKEIKGGMSLRDWFAGQAIGAIIAAMSAGQHRPNYHVPMNDSIEAVQTIARRTECVEIER